VERSATSSGVPATTISPPLSAPSEPGPITQSPQRIQSRLGSITKGMEFKGRGSKEKGINIIHKKLTASCL